jgi:L-histidine Nalpha-methyltransferase / hercynylcysteine S-oxide synthase
MSTSEIGGQLEGKVATKGMWGTYDEGLRFVEEDGIRGPEIISPSEKSFPFESYGDSSPSSESSTTSPPSLSDVNSDIISTPDAGSPPLHILFLGSSLGNFHRGEDAQFLRNLPLRPGSGDTLLLGLDHDNEAGEIEEAYNDSKGITRKFIMNGELRMLRSWEGSFDFLPRSQSRRNRTR